METHAPVIYDDIKGVVPLTDPRCNGCSYIAFEDLVEGDHVVAASQGGTLPYVRRMRRNEMAQAVVVERHLPQNETVEVR